MGETELIELLVPDRFQLSRSITNIYGICVADIKTSIFEKKLRDYGQILSLKLQDNLFYTKLNYLAVLMIRFGHNLVTFFQK